MYERRGVTKRHTRGKETVGLGERLGHLPSEMSGGRQQRVAIARALVKQPKVLLADEPTGNLDESMCDEITEVLERMWKELGLTFIMVTHDSSIARRAPRLATVRKGRITVKENAGAQGLLRKCRRPPAGRACQGGRGGPIRRIRNSVRAAA